MHIGFWFKSLKGDHSEDLGSTELVSAEAMTKVFYSAVINASVDNHLKSLPHL
jgi:hypothetical protein